MKTPSLLFLLLISFIGCQPKDLPTQIKVGTDTAFLRISHMTTFEELQKAVAEFKSQGIDIGTEGSTFYENKKIQNLIFTVRMPDGTSGGCMADIVKLQFSYQGFEYNIKGDGKLKVGNLSE